jgi:hypothetical protein
VFHKYASAGFSARSVTAWYSPDNPTSAYTTAVIADTCPNSMPKMAATRSKRAMATSPQLSAPTTTSSPVIASNVFMSLTSCL